MTCKIAWGIGTCLASRGSMEKARTFATIKDRTSAALVAQNYP